MRNRQHVLRHFLLTTIRVNGMPIIRVNGGPQVEPFIGPLQLTQASVIDIPSGKFPTTTPPEASTLLGHKVRFPLPLLPSACLFRGDSGHRGTTSPDDRLCSPRSASNRRHAFLGATQVGQPSAFISVCKDTTANQHPSRARGNHPLALPEIHLSISSPNRLRHTLTERHPFGQHPSS